MKILHIFDHSIPLHSGYTFRSKAILENQHKLGFVTEHLTSFKHNIAAEPAASEETIDGLHFYRTSIKPGPISRLPVLNQLAIVSSLKRRLEEILPVVKPDIIHAHSPSLNGIAAIKVGKKFNIPVVYEIRAFWEDAAVDHGATNEGSLRYKLTKFSETWVAKKANAVTTICEGLKQDLMTRGISEGKITVIPNAVDIEKFSLSREPDREIVQQLGLKDKMVIGFIGSFYAYEGLPLLIEAIDILKTKREDLVLLLVGGGPQDSNLKKLVENKNISERVIFTGRVPHDQVGKYYDLVNIFVYPRIAIRLTELVTPLKPLEAMAMGHVVLASDIGGHRELINNGVNGVLFPAGDAHALAEKIDEITRDREQWKDFGLAGRQYVEQVRNWEASVNNYINVYNNLK